MFSIFKARRSYKIQIARGADDLLARMGRCIAARRAALEALGDRHCDVDLALVGKIEQTVSPFLGPSEPLEGSKWFQSMDWHGDGIRHLEFQPGEFRSDFIPLLQALLKDRHLNFGILCWAPMRGKGLSGVESDGVVIFSDTLILTAGFARAWEHA